MELVGKANLNLCYKPIHLSLKAVYECSEEVHWDCTQLNRTIHILIWWQRTDKRHLRFEECSVLCLWESKSLGMWTSFNERVQGLPSFLPREAGMCPHIQHSSAINRAMRAWPEILLQPRRGFLSMERSLSKLAQSLQELVSEGHYYANLVKKFGRYFDSQSRGGK